MVPKLGMGELIVILIIVVVLFGANRLPQLGAGLGETIRNLKQAINGDEEKPTTTNAAPPPAPASGETKKTA